MLQLDAQNRALETVHPTIPADDSMVILLCLAMIAKSGHASPEFWVVGDASTGFAASTEVLSGIKAKTTDVTDGTGAFPIIFCTVCLACILNDKEIVLPRHFHDGIHVGHLTVKMDGN